jgi:glycolate oxidase iron-sulfur subunit
VAAKVPRYGINALQRSLLKAILPRPWIFAPALRIGQWLRPLLPDRIKAKIPPSQRSGAWPQSGHPRRMIALAGCVQPSLAPGINAATARVLDRLGIRLIEAPDAGCCGAIRFHLDDVEAAREDARRNIDAWLPMLDGGAEAIVMTASGCGAQVRDYVNLLLDDRAYAVKAARVALLTRDISEIVAAEAERLSALLSAVESPNKVAEPIAFHSPCTLQHGQKIRGVVEELLVKGGYRLTPVADSHICCGSAGTYSLLQPKIAGQLRDNKLAALTAGQPARIATGNIGCLRHLASGAGIPVQHWIELLDERLASAKA